MRGHFETFTNDKYNQYFSVPRHVLESNMCLTDALHVPATKYRRLGDHDEEDDEHAPLDIDNTGEVLAEADGPEVASNVFFKVILKNLGGKVTVPTFVGGGGRLSTKDVAITAHQSFTSSEATNYVHSRPCTRGSASSSLIVADLF